MSCFLWPCQGLTAAGWEKDLLPLEKDPRKFTAFVGAKRKIGHETRSVLAGQSRRIILQEQTNHQMFTMDSFPRINFLFKSFFQKVCFLKCQINNKNNKKRVWRLSCWCLLSGCLAAAASSWARSQWMLCCRQKPGSSDKCSQ